MPPSSPGGPVRSRRPLWLATLTSAPWRRAPRLLWRHGGVIATIVLGSFVTALSVAAVPVFLSSAATEAISVQAAQRCAVDTGADAAVVAAVPGVPAPSVDERLPPGELPSPPIASAEEAAEALASLPDRSLLREPELWFGTDLELGVDGGEPTAVSLLGRDDALDHVEVLDGVAGPGVWVSDRLADPAGISRGDVLTARTSWSRGDRGDPAEGAVVEVPVAGVYRDLTGRAEDPFWCAHASLLELRGTDPVPPPPLVLADRATYLDLMRSLGLGGTDGGLQASLAGEMTLTEAEALAADLEATSVELTTHLPFVVERTRAIRTSVAGGVVPVAAFGLLAGVGLLAAAASLWFDRRRREVALLDTRGVAPVAIGVKAVLEALPALAAGGVGGCAAAYVLVTWLGPSSMVETAAVRGAALGAFVATSASAFVTGAVVAWRTRTSGVRVARRRVLARVPWELVLVAAAVLSHRRLGRWGVPVGSGAEVSRVDVFGLMFPLLFLVAGVAVVARLLVLALGPVRRASARWPSVPFLAVRRVARHRAAVLGLVGAAAVAGGVLAYAATVTRSLDATLAAKAHTAVGADVAVRLPSDADVPDELAASSTTVDVYRGAAMDVGNDTEEVQLLVVDPDTFAAAAYWDPTFADTSLDELVETLSEPSEDGHARVVVMGDAPATAEVKRRAFSSEGIPVEPVDGVRAFPGAPSHVVTVVLARPAVEQLDLIDGVSEVWVRGDRDRVLEAFDDAGIRAVETRTVDGVVDRASFLTVSWTFGVMQALGVVAGVLAVGGAALYLDAGRRSRTLAYAFAQRMGLDRAAHRLVIFGELVASVVVGCWLGLGVALLGARLAYLQIDPVPALRPEPLLRPAVPLGVGLAIGALVAAALAAVVAQWRTDRDDPVEVLRAGG